MKLTWKYGSLALLAAFVLIPAVAASKSQPQENIAVILGEAGEHYPLIGSGGIIVSGGHHGFFASNMKSSTIQIDGSQISAHALSAVGKNEDFAAVPGNAYFAYQSLVCILPDAAGFAGQEIVVCNATTSGAVTFKPPPGGTLPGAGSDGSISDSTPGRVHRFISDGKNWYRE